MKSLYETILSSTNSGKTNYIKRLFCSPNNEELIGKEWSRLGLDYDAGDGAGKWSYNISSKQYAYNITLLNPRKEREEWALILTNPQNEEVLVILLNEKVGKRKLTKWAEKISRVLNLTIEYDKNYLHMTFV